MNRGIVYMAWDMRDRANRGCPLQGDFVEELSYSVKLARKLGLPIALLIEDGSELALDLRLFDQVIGFDGKPYDKPGSEMFLRKFEIYEKSPFETTLYLDTDAFIVDETFPLSPGRVPQKPAPIVSFEFPFAAAERYGLAMAHDLYTLGEWEMNGSGQPHVPYDQFQRAVDMFAPGATYVPLFNGGVIFFSKKNEFLLPLIERAKEVSIAANCDDQSGISVATYCFQYPLHVLHGRVWCCREHDGPHMCRWGARIMHNPQFFKDLKQAGHVK